MKQHVTSFFPDGKFITYDDIRKGDTVARGGITVTGSTGEHMSIDRAWLEETYPDGHSEWLDCDPKLSWEDTVALKNSPNLEFHPWYYRINLPDPISPEQVTNQDWTAQVLNLFLENTDSSAISYEEIEDDDYLLTAITTPGQINDDSEYFPQIVLGQAGKKANERKGWLLKDDESGFLIAMEPQDGWTLFNGLWKVKL